MRDVMGRRTSERKCRRVVWVVRDELPASVTVALRAGTWTRSNKHDTHVLVDNTSATDGVRGFTWPRSRTRSPDGTARGAPAVTPARCSAHARTRVVRTAP